MMFGSEYGLKVYSEPDEGTKVVVHIPVSYTHLDVYKRQGQQVTVTVQFQIEGDCEGYQPGYVGLNDVGQNSESATEFMLSLIHI